MFSAETQAVVRTFFSPRRRYLVPVPVQTVRSPDFVSVRFANTYTAVGLNTDLALRCARLARILVKRTKLTNTLITNRPTIGICADMMVAAVMLWLDDATLSSAFLFFANAMRACPSAVGRYFLLNMLRLLSSSVGSTILPAWGLATAAAGHAGHPRVRAFGQIGQAGQAGGVGQHLSTGATAGEGAGVGATGQAANLGKSEVSMDASICFSGKVSCLLASHLLTTVCASTVMTGLVEQRQITCVFDVAIWQPSLTTSCRPYVPAVLHSKVAWQRSVVAVAGSGFSASYVIDERSTEGRLQFSEMQMNLPPLLVGGDHLPFF